MELLRYDSVDSDLKCCFVTFYCFARFTTQKEEVLLAQNKLNNIARNNHARYNFFKLKLRQDLYEVERFIFRAKPALSVRVGVIKSAG